MLGKIYKTSFISHPLHSINPLLRIPHPFMKKHTERRDSAFTLFDDISPSWELLLFSIGSPWCIHVTECTSWRNMRPWKGQCDCYMKETNPVATNTKPTKLWAKDCCSPTMKIWSPWSIKRPPLRIKEVTPSIRGRCKVTYPLQQ